MYLVKSSAKDFAAVVVGTLCLQLCGAYSAVDSVLNGAYSVLANGFVYPGLCACLRFIIKRFNRKVVSFNSDSTRYYCEMGLLFVSILVGLCDF